MDNPELKARTKMFARRVIGVVRALPDDRIANPIANPIANQIVRSGTSIAANYRAACFAKSRADFINKIKICIEETDETALWLEIITEEKIIESKRIEPLHREPMNSLRSF